jgi:hypothetical protein
MSKALLIDSMVRKSGMDEKKATMEFLSLYTSTDINYRELNPLLVVSALRASWNNENNPAFIAQAVLTLINAPKGDSVLKFL